MAQAGGRNVLRSLSRDEDYRDHQLKPGTYRRVLAQAAPFKGLIVLFIATIVVISALGVAPALLFRAIIDDGVLAGNLDVVIWLAVVVAGMALLSAGLQLLERWCSARIGEGLILNLRTQIFAHVLKMPIAFISRSNTGKLVSRLQSDVAGAQQTFTSTLSTLVNSIITVALVLVSMFWLSPWLTLGALVLLPIFMLPARRIGKRLAGLTARSMEHNATLAATMTERFSVSGTLLVKLFGRPAEEQERFATEARALADIGVRIAMVMRIFRLSMVTVAALATAMIYGFGGWQAIEGDLTVGTLTALVALLNQLYGPLMSLTTARVDVMSAIVSFERVFEVLDLEPLIQDAPDAAPVSKSASVELDDVWFTYPDPRSVSLASLETATSVEEKPNEPVLQGVSFRADPGQTVALVGPSGAGKTTITHLLARLYDTTSGTVRIGGDDVRDVTLASLTEQIGYVTQDAHMFQDTIRANLVYARPGATEAQIWEALRDAQVATLVERLPDGLDTMVGERGYRLSGGERQRFAIARLLLKSPPIVVLDEATAHLDSDSEALVHEALERMQEGRTTVVIAHRLSTVRGADQILVIEAGRVVERGTHQELLAAGGRYATLYSKQFADD